MSEQRLSVGHGFPFQGLLLKLVAIRLHSLIALTDQDICGDVYRIATCARYNDASTMAEYSVRYAGNFTADSDLAGTPNETDTALGTGASKGREFTLKVIERAAIQNVEKLLSYIRHHCGLQSFDSTVVNVIAAFETDQHILIIHEAVPEESFVLFDSTMHNFSEFLNCSRIDRIAEIIPNVAQGLSQLNQNTLSPGSFGMHHVVAFLLGRETTTGPPRYSAKIHPWSSLTAMNSIDSNVDSPFSQCSATNSPTFKLGIALLDTIYGALPSWPSMGPTQPSMFPEFVRDPFRFLTTRLMKLSPGLAKFLADHVFCNLEIQISVADLGEWVKDNLTRHLACPSSGASPRPFWGGDISPIETGVDEQRRVECYNMVLVEIAKCVPETRVDAGELDVVECENEIIRNLGAMIGSATAFIGSTSVDVVYFIAELLVSLLPSLFKNHRDRPSAIRASHLTVILYTYLGMLPSSMSIILEEETGTGLSTPGSSSDIARHFYEGRQVAVKMYRFGTQMSTHEYASLRRCIVHEGLVALIASIGASDYTLPVAVTALSPLEPPSIVTPWANRGRLTDHLKRIPPSMESPEIDLPEFLRDTMWPVADAVDALHQLGIVHNDLRAGNIVVDGYGKTWIVDFGMASIDGVDFDASTDRVGSIAWQAPERLGISIPGSNDDSDSSDDLVCPTTASDVFSLARMLLEIWTGKPPFFHIRAAAALASIANGGVPLRASPDLWRAVPDPLWDLLLQCWDVQPSQRPTALEVANAVHAMRFSPTPLATPVHLNLNSHHP